MCSSFSLTCCSWPSCSWPSSCSDDQTLEAPPPTLNPPKTQTGESKKTSLHWIGPCMMYAAGGDFQIGERGKDDRCSTSHGRLLQSASMDISRGSSEWLNTDDVGHQGPAAKSIMMRNYSTAKPFRQQLWSPCYYSNAQPISGFESQTCIAGDAGSIKESFPDSNSHGHEFTTSSRVPFEGFGGSSTSLTSNDRTSDTPELLLYPESEVLSHTSMEMEISTSTCTLEGSSVETSPMDSSTGFASNEE